MCSYINASWSHVSSCIPKSNLRGPLHRWINASSSLAQFQSAFHETYHAHKFWKVPDPQLRDLMRGTITSLVITSYREYLKEHLEVAENVSRGSSSPDICEEMLASQKNVRRCWENYLEDKNCSRHDK